MPSSVTNAYRGLARRVYGRLGDGYTVTLRKPNTLMTHTALPDSDGPALLSSGAFLTGVSTVNIDSSGLRGRMSWGTTFTYSGHGTAYTTTNTIEAASGVLTGVKITPVLASNVANNEAVTITQNYGTHTFNAVRTKFQEQDDKDFVERNMKKVHLLVHADGIEPRVGDQIDDGVRREIIQKMLDVSPGGGVTRWICFAGDAAGRTVSR